MDQPRRGFYSIALATLKRTEQLPGGEVRGLPGGKVIRGFTGLHRITLDLAEAEKEDQQGRVRSALDRVQQISQRFDAQASRWESELASLLRDVRCGKDLKHLDKLKRLKSLQTEMRRLISAAQKALKDLKTALHNEVIPEQRETLKSRL